jgi:hypothetical protein
MWKTGNAEKSVFLLDRQEAEKGGTAEVAAKRRRGTATAQTAKRARNGNNGSTADYADSADRGDEGDRKEA